MTWGRSPTCRSRWKAGWQPAPRIVSTSPCFPGIVARLIQFLDAHLAVADELLGVVAAAVDLQGDAAARLMSLLRVGVVHELHALDPGRDGGRIADNAGPQLVPFAVLPERGPFLRRDRQRERRLRLLDLVH